MKKQFLITVTLCKDVKDLIDLAAGRVYTIDGVTDVTATDELAPLDRLSKDDLEQLKRQAIERHNGEWLHHWGYMIEAEVLKRLGRG